MTLALLLTAVTGAWATEFTSLKLRRCAPRRRWNEYGYQLYGLSVNSLDPRGYQPKRTGQDKQANIGTVTNDHY